MSHALIAHLHDLLDGLGTVSSRAMFGGHGVYLDGMIIGLVADEAFYLKTDAQTRPHFQAAGSVPFTYEKKGEPCATSYWLAPDEAMESPQGMRPWARLAFETALRKPSASKTVRKKRPSNAPMKGRRPP